MGYSFVISINEQLFCSRFILSAERQTQANSDSFNPQQNIYSTYLAYVVLDFICNWLQT